jgi:ABC-type Fe3+/spermidine/putrescine transport system ATPase subunit
MKIAQPATLHLERIRFAYGATPIVKDVSLIVEPGELMVIVGPSGCGKSTLLRLVAGLLQPQDGTLWIDTHDVRQLPPERRRVGWVPQSYALFEHLSVAENIAFGPRMAGVKSAERRVWVDELLTLCRISELAGRSVRSLSGGQRQRVAIARALASRPRVLLLDEPLAALDPQLRHELRARLVELVRASGVTTLFVTHDQAEALAVADRIVVLDAGRVAQVGTPRQLWETPHNAFVARFLSAAEVITARRVGPEEVEIMSGLRGRINSAPPAPADAVALALRPADLLWGAAGVSAEVVQAEYLGGRYQLRVAVAGGLELPCVAHSAVARGAQGTIGVHPEARLTVVGS